MEFSNFGTSAFDLIILLLLRAIRRMKMNGLLIEFEFELDQKLPAAIMADHS
jgi:hypothetical protein